jgi:hypothetical protein
MRRRWRLVVRGAWVCSVVRVGAMELECGMDSRRLGWKQSKRRRLGARELARTAY